MSEILRGRRYLYQALAMPLLFGAVAAYLFILFRQQKSQDTWFYFCQMFAISPILLNIPAGVSLTTGEKERRTIETTLTLCASRRELIYGKQLAIMLTNFVSASVMFSSIATACFIVSYIFPSQDSIPAIRFYERLAICYIVDLVIYIPWFSSVILVAGLFASNTKEATGFVNALFMVMAFFPIAATAFGLKLTYFTIVLPIINCNLVCRQFLNSSVQWTFWLILLCTMAVYTWIPIQYAIRLLEKDAMLTAP